MNLIKKVSKKCKIVITEVDTKDDWCTVIKFLVNDTIKRSFVYYPDKDKDMIDKVINLTECMITEHSVTFEDNHRYRITNGDNVIRVQKIHGKQSFTHNEYEGISYFDYYGCFGHFQPEDDVWKGMYFIDFDENTIIEEFTDDEDETRDFVETYKKDYNKDDSPNLLEKTVDGGIGMKGIDE